MSESGSSVINDRLVQDTRIALRALRRNPTFTVTAVSILGIAIGMAAAMWTVFNAVVLRTLPVRDQDAIIVPAAFDQSGVEIALSGSEFNQLRHESRTMRDVAGFAHWGAFAFPLVGPGGQSVVLAASQVTGNFFGVLGARPALGRFLQPSDDVQGAAPVMVISFSTWQRQFGGDPAVIGHVLADPGQQITYSIIGVAPPGLDYPAGVECWTAAALRGSPYANVVGAWPPGARSSPRAPSLPHSCTAWTASIRDASIPSGSKRRRWRPPLSAMSNRSSLCSRPPWDCCS